VAGLRPGLSPKVNPRKRKRKRKGKGNAISWRVADLSFSVSFLFYVLFPKVNFGFALALMYTRERWKDREKTNGILEDVECLLLCLSSLSPTHSPDASGK